MDLDLVTFSEVYLQTSAQWLQDIELRMLIDAVPVSPEAQRDWFSSLGDRSDYMIWGVERQGQPVGAAGLKAIAGGQAEYWGYFGEKQCWGKGLGSELMGLVECKALEIGVREMHLRVRTLNIRAINLYFRQGYRIKALLQGDSYSMIKKFYPA